MFDTTHVLMGMPDQDHPAQSQGYGASSSDAMPTLPLELYPHPQAHPHPHPQPQPHPHHPHPPYPALSSASTASSTPSSASDHFVSTATMFASPSISFSSSDDASEDDKKRPTLLALAPPPPPSSASSSPLTDSSDSKSLPTVPSTLVGPPLRRKRSINTTRERMKEELTYLRRKVRDLERDLHALQHRQRQRQAAAVLGRIWHDARTLWERVAKQQRVERQRAERRNAELKGTLEDQLKVARSLEKVLLKRPTATFSSDLLDDLEARSKRIRTALHPQDAALSATFQRLLARAEKSYFQVDAEWRRLGFHNSFRECSDSHVLVEDVSNRLYLEAINAKLVPFPLEATTAATWRCLNQDRLLVSSGVYRGVETSPHTICATSHVVFPMGPNIEARTTMSLLTKRYIEAERVILVLESESVCAASLDVAHSVSTIERGWVVMRSVPLAPSNTEDTGLFSGICGGTTTAVTTETTEATLIQVYMRLTPSVADALIEKTSSAPAGTLTELVLAAFHQNLSFLYQTVENMLVEEATRPQFA
ncbi:hypothetical protein PINS_up022445 [Pythium insidiosum]|nr:hypothetical protein PINS_up022445 [Pythium insidiosum]